MPFVLDHFFCNWSMVIPYHLCICKISNSIIFLHSVFKFQFSNCPTRSLFCKLFYQIFHTANPWLVSDWLTVSWWLKERSIEAEFWQRPNLLLFLWALNQLNSDVTIPSVKSGKRLDGPIIPLSWSVLEKGFTYGCDWEGVVINFFLCFGPSSAWWQTTERSTGWS